MQDRIESTSLLGRWAARFARSSVGSWVAAAVMVGLPFIAANIITKLTLLDAGQRDVRNLIKSLVLVAAYAAYVRWWERRPVRELSLSGAGQETLAGLLLGGLLFAAIMATMTGLGAYSLDAMGSLGDLGAAFVDLMPRVIAGGLIEEVIFRLIALRLLERSLGTGWALAISSVLFGAAHLGNVGATPLIALMLGIELGLLFGACYLLTRRLWLCAAAHVAWNFVQGGIFSIAVSGQSGNGWLHGSLIGPTWLTGGAFGVEGSVITFVLCLSTAIALLVLRHRRGHRAAALTGSV